MKRSAKSIRIPRTALITMLSCSGSIALALVALEAQPLRPHPLDLLIEHVHLLVLLFGSRFRRLVGADLVQRLFHREFLGISHDVCVLPAKGCRPDIFYLPVLANAVSMTSPIGCHVRPSNWT